MILYFFFILFPFLMVCMVRFESLAGVDHSANPAVDFITDDIILFFIQHGLVLSLPIIQGGRYCMIMCLRSASSIIAIESSSNMVSLM